MGAYNRYDEFYCCENKKLLIDILRDQWGFDGFVMSDFVFAVHDAEHSLRAGLDLEMMLTMHYAPGKIKKCLRKGRLNEAHIDRAVENILKALMRQVPHIKPRPMSVVGCAEHRALAREIAEKGMVLLENKGVLPLPTDANIMVCGEYSTIANTGDYGSSRVFDKDVITPIEALKAKFKSVSEDGDVAVVCVGSNHKAEGEYFAKTSYALAEKPKDSGGDRASLRLSDAEVRLIKGLHDAGKKVVVVLYSGCAILVEEWRQHADAIIMNYYSGCEGASALANLLCGDANFSGKLPFTVAKDESDYPAIIGIGDKPYEIEYGYYHGYTLFDKEDRRAAYPFGYGLSYTDFEIGAITVEQTDHQLIVRAAVRNTGGRMGAEVVQVYVGSAGAQEHRPVKLLKGFGRIELGAGEMKNIEIAIEKDDMRFYSNGKWLLDPAYIIYVGSSSVDAMKRFVKISIGA